ncbi:MAG: hypothetical protein AAGC88_09230 [Bacteroidota bacterium]
MKQQKIFTLAILIATFTLLWENEQVISATVSDVIESQHAGEWLKSNFAAVKCRGTELLTLELPEKVEGVVQILLTKQL